MILFLILIFAVTVNPVFAQSPHASLQATAVAIPGGEGGISFDDLVYSAALHKVLVPAGHTGKLYLIDPVNFAMTSMGGFSSSAVMEKGHEIGISSADEGEGVIFAADHGKHELIAVFSGSVIATVPLAGDADYVRTVKVDHYIGDNLEVWVTEPHNRQIEVFSFIFGDKSGFVHLKDIPVPQGPESLVIDQSRGLAYTNLGPEAAAINFTTHHIVNTWPNDCIKSRGDALDVPKGFLFVSCGEGRAVVFDLNHGNKEISNIVTDPGPDVISYNPKLSHLYFTSSKNATLTVLGVSAHGKLSVLGKAPADKRAHCVVSDDQNNIWVCDPPRGQLLRYKDSL
jgi:hypothetical protein